jgi:hypothetical protein
MLDRESPSWELSPALWGRGDIFCNADLRESDLRELLLDLRLRRAPLDWERWLFGASTKGEGGDLEPFDALWEVLEDSVNDEGADLDFFDVLDEVWLAAACLFDWKVIELRSLFV